MNLLLEKPADVSALSPLTLAFVGDSVFDLLVRSELVCEANRPVDTLHKTAARIVCASAQAGGIPKNQSSADYHYATGLESLFGWLYLKGMTDRINELYSELRRSDG